MLKYDKLELVKKEIAPLMDKVYEICEENDLPFFSFIMAAADEEKKDVDWISSRMIPEAFKLGENPAPDSLWALLEVSHKIMQS